MLQGGLIYGTVENADKVTVFDRGVHIDEKGEFIFGVGRDAPSSLPLKVQWQSGEVETVSVPIKSRTYDIQRIDGVDDKYVRELSEDLLKRTREEAGLVWAARQNLRQTAEFLQGFYWPAKGPVTGVYGSQRVFNGVPKRPHYSLDIAGPTGTPVKAPAGGIVTLAHPDMYYSGGTLIIDHGQGLSSTFIHLSKIHVKKGQTVAQGELIADMGATGRVTGPHLDWRINWFNQRLDPALVLPVGKTGEN